MFTTDDPAQTSSRLADKQNNRNQAVDENSGIASVLNQGIFKETFSEYTSSSNKLLNTSADLLAVYLSVPNLHFDENSVMTFRLDVVRMIIDLKYKVVNAEYPPSVAENLCLLYAIVFDEAVLKTQWGQDALWQNNPIVVDLFGFREGGNKFFDITERALLQPKRMVDFLGLIHFFLKVGYVGRYGNTEHYKLNLLIKRIEKSLNLNGDNITKPYDLGREVEQTYPVRFQLSFLSQAVYFSLFILATFLLSYTLNAYQLSQLDSAFGNQDKATSAKAIYIYDSETKNTSVETEG